MPSGLRETTKPQFEIYIEKPFGGIASNASPVDFLDNQFQDASGLIQVDQQLCQQNVVAAASTYKFNPAVTNAVPLTIFNLGGNVYSIDQFGNFYFLTSDMSGNTYFHKTGQASDAPWSLQYSDTIAVQVVNGVAYLGINAMHSTYTFDGGLLSLATNYTGGLVMGVLDDYLLQMNTNNIVDGEKPTRVNWSGPGKFSTWDPSIDRTAGFNTLADIEDEITGFISLASVGVIIGRKELIEVSPTGSAIQPFNFTTLWSSRDGQGIDYPGTITQYGQRTYAATDTGVYRISTGGFEEISGAARTVIFRNIQTPPSANTTPGFVLPNTLYAGTLMLYAYNSPYPTPYYIFVALVPNTVILNFWFYNLETGEWYRNSASLDTLVSQQNGVSVGGSPGNLYSLHATTVTNPGGVQAATLIYGAVRYDSGIWPFIATPYIFNASNYLNTNNVPSTISLISKAYELKPDREPTIRRVLVKGYGQGTLAISVNGVLFGNITFNAGNTLRSYLSPQGICTDKDPTITISSTNFLGVIVKIMAPGTYAEGDID